MKYKSTVKVGIDEITLVLFPNEKVPPDEWIIKADEILGRFIDLSKIEELFGKMQEAQYGVQQGYSTGLTFENKPWHMSISWHEYLQTMGICIKFSAYAWSVYQSTFFERYGKRMNIALFLKMIQSDFYIARLSRIDMTADYFNFHKCFNPNTIYQNLKSGSIIVKDYKNRSMIKTFNGVDKNGIISTLYVGSRKSNTRCFTRIYDKKAEQIETKGFRYEEAINCKSWIRQEVVFKGTYAHQITEELLNITDEKELVQFITHQITDRYRFYDIQTKKEMKYTRALLYIMNNAQFNHLSTAIAKDNDLKRSIIYLLKGSGLCPTFYKAFEVWGEGADKEIANYLFEYYEKFYIPEANQKKEIKSWIKKHRSTLRQQTITEYLKGVWV